MSKMLVLAEKPSVGRDLARVLNCSKNGSGFFESPRYIVTWALGHLVTLADPEVYNEKYKAWRLEDLPMLPAHLQLVVIKQTAKQFNTVKGLLLRSDVGEVIIATDAGREGELVARWIIEKAQAKKPVKRLWISSVTDKAIKEGFSKLRPGREYENLYASAVARAEADWLVGINATRALTCKYNAQLSCGRVQTPTLAIIAGREAEIQNFAPRSFFGITALADQLKLYWQDTASNEFKSFSREKCQTAIAALTGKAAQVVSVNKSARKKYAPQLYDLTELQRDANKIYGFSAKETLSYMQKLYETHKILTYPRTDSRYLSSDLVDTLKDRLNACSIGPYAQFAFKLIKAPIKAGKHFVDDSKVSDHHAIIPTEQYVNLSALTDKERKIYDLVVKRFLAVMYPPFEYEQTTVVASIGPERFVAKGKTIIARGWREIYQGLDNDGEEADNELADQLLPSLAQGDTMKINALNLTQGATKPPAPFNEATLLTAMESPQKYMADASGELRKTIDETGGLGTVATRADIIEKLFAGFFIEKKGKDIWLTSKGRQLLELVPAELKSPALTAQWEQQLKQIAMGKLAKANFIGQMKSYAKEVVHKIKNSQEKFRHDNMTRSKCPDCGKYLLEVNGKKGRMLVCQDRECGYRKGLAKVTNARCPVCHKKLELRGEGEGRLFVCACGHREKLTAFNERKKQEQPNLSKREVSQYLQQQNKSDHQPINTALAEALAKLKLTDDR
ncbi:DNA topoisomerase III|uniref:DNA topoisomerase 3 n=1 Tax=Dendrosporobacter quercicolus TaxID=146817 RepID=A0A1G9T5Y7_9FIRM|nr:DNA topoisomerase III [Dendrosporobacter quercicolus]NSL48513.1 DNA topoisomerase III [Dendrosporobacter quercicolus DSM 1736]SDM43047.1 DNA topoisomerase-3 [Dendrosporobacter quercicolus]